LIAIAGTGTKDWETVNGALLLFCPNMTVLPLKVREVFDELPYWNCMELFWLLMILVFQSWPEPTP